MKNTLGVLGFAVCAMAIGALAPGSAGGEARTGTMLRHGGGQAVVIPPSAYYPGVTAEVVRVLSPVDAGRLKAEDEARAKDGERTRRLGVVRDLSAPVRLGKVAGDSRWTRLPDGGHLWLGSFRAEGATSIRLEVSMEAFPGDGEMIVRGADVAGEAYRVFPSYERKAGESVWTETIWSDGATLEIYLPPGVDPGEVRVSIKRVVHGYVRWAELASAKAGPCQVDASCFPWWANQARAVAGLGFVSQEGFLFCTGCMVTDGGPIAFDNHYLLTAFHCIGSQREANSVEAYWFFQSSACNGAAPNVRTVPRTGGGADFLAGSSRFQGTDVALLRLRNPPPNGVVYAGWTTVAPPSSEILFTIHHPDGSAKKLSQGFLRFPGRRYWWVTWQQGVTEPGSSGAPLFNSNGQVIGQLWGGFSSCRRPSAPDSYGRFDVSFGQLRGWLAPKMRQVRMGPTSRAFDGGGQAGWAVYWPSGGRWYLRGAKSTETVERQWGWSDAVAVPGDYRGTGRATPAVYDRQHGGWFIDGDGEAGAMMVQWGGPGMIAVPGDYDGDGVDDVAVYEVATGTWWIWESGGERRRSVQWGWADAVPVPADYTGDGRVDVAVYHPAEGMWYILEGTTGRLRKVQWGWSAAHPVAADYNGDGRADVAVYDPDRAMWFVLSGGGAGSVEVWGNPGDLAVPSDYDGDGVADVAVYSPLTGRWTVRSSATGEVRSDVLGWNRAYPAGPLD
ncbi:MAG TPA: trypsin-like peptidase domain-containing protein [Kiritimatiellia bacterium]|nr:trypsin-like peptidase domain-containing protein [Kiritimatiellia bacterium]